ncbi:hypothetical protein ABIB95_004817 [Bradyrhizobium sp. LA2.1]
MALAGNWQVAALLILAERIGRAIRKPTVEAMLSYTTGKHGKGWVYGVNTALDETGATLGPLIMALVLLLHGDYRTGYALLLVSSVFTLGALTVARINFPVPSRLEEGRTARAGGLSRSYWLYMVAAACFAAGLMSYELVAYHLVTAKIVTENWIPVFLAFSTACGVIASLVLGGSGRNGVLGYWIRSAGHVAQGTGGRRAARRQTQSGVRSVLYRVWSGVADRQRRDRAAV